MSLYREKYLSYKKKYLELKRKKNLIGGNMTNIDELKNQVLVLSGAFPELRPKEVLNVIAKLENIPESKINNNSESNYTTQNYQGAVLSTAPSTAPSTAYNIYADIENASEEKEYREIFNNMKEEIIDANSNITFDHIEIIMTMDFHRDIPSQLFTKSGREFTEKYAKEMLKKLRYFKDKLKNNNFKISNYIVGLFVEYNGDVGKIIGVNGDNYEIKMSDDSDETLKFDEFQILGIQNFNDNKDKINKIQKLLEPSIIIQPWGP